MGSISHGVAPPSSAPSTPDAPEAPGGVRSIGPAVLATWSVLGVYLLVALVVRPGSDLSNCATAGVARLAHWDSGWYGLIARSGYPHVAGVQQPSAFFPLFPLLARVGHTLLPFVSIESCGIIMNLIAITAAMALVDRTVASWPTWQRVGCVVILLVLPGAYFYVAFYSEALFALGVALVAWSLRRSEHLWIAVVGVVIASLDRSIGIVLLFPVALVALRTRERRDALWLVTASCGGVVAFGVWIVLAGKVDLFRDSRSGWRGAGGLSYPAYLVSHGFSETVSLLRNAALGRTVTTDPDTGTSWAWGLGLAMDGVLTVALLSLRRVRQAERHLVPFAAIIGVATLLAGPAISQIRFTLVLLPVWIAVLGIVRRNPAAWLVLGGGAVASLAANVYLMGQFSACRWAG